jgi:hypothetical protein
LGVQCTSASGLNSSLRLHGDGEEANGSFPVVIWGDKEGRWRQVELDGGDGSGVEERSRGHKWARGRTEKLSVTLIGRRGKWRR